MIRSMRTVLCRALLGVLADRQFNLFAVAEACQIPLPDLRRLIEFGSPLDAEAAERLIVWGMRMAVVARPKGQKRTPVRICQRA
jgi:hypothetical protein